MERSGVNPGEERLADRTVTVLATQQADEKHCAEHERGGRSSGADEMAESVAFLAPDEKDSGAGERDGHEEPQQVEHGRPLELQQARVVDRSRATRAIDGHDDGEADDNFCCRDNHDEECGDLTVEVPVLAGETHEREIRRVEHEFDTHEDHDGIAAYEDSGGTDREQDHRERYVFVHCSPPSICFAMSCMSSSNPSRTWPRWRRVAEIDNSDGVPSGNSAGVSTALWRG